MRAISRFGLAAIVMCSFAAFIACRRAQELRPRLILQGEPVGDEFWLAAPDVAAVRIVGAALQGKPEPIFSGGPPTLQLVRFDANVENVIKGDLPTNEEIHFFFFAKLDQNPNYYLDPGKRYIVSLRREGGVLRTWADASQLKIEVHSGTHDQAELPIAAGPRMAIAYILLTPGHDCNLHEFATRLNWPPLSSLEPGYVNRRLLALQNSSDREVRDAACLTDAAVFGYRPKCLDQVVQSPDRQARLSATKRLAEDDPNLPSLLQRKPSPLFLKPWTNYITQMLEIYTEDLRPEVRIAACAYLGSFAPQEAVDRCP